MIEMHKKQLEWFKSKLGISDYTVAWIAFLKGLILGLLIYHFFINPLHIRKITQFWMPA
jgi:hypothetical protein